MSRDTKQYLYRYIENFNNDFAAGLSNLKDSGDAAGAVKLKINILGKLSDILNIIKYMVAEGARYVIETRMTSKLQPLMHFKKFH